MSGRNPSDDEHESALEPEILDPSDDEVIEAEATPIVLDLPQADGRMPADAQAVAPVTGLQQYLAEIRRYPYLSKEEELLLFHEYHVQGSREAAVKLIMANLRVSVAIASEYLHTGADHMDLIQEGNVGLMQAIKKFDPASLVVARLHSPLPPEYVPARQNRHHPRPAEALLQPEEGESQARPGGVRPRHQTPGRPAERPRARCHRDGPAAW